MITHKVFVAVPVGADFFSRGVFCTAIDLHKTYAALNEPTSQKALSAKGANVFLIELVELLGEIRFASQIGDFGCAELQACREFICGDASFELRVASTFGCMRTIEGLQEFTARLLGVAAQLRETFGWKQIGDGWLFGIGLQGRPLMHGGEKARAPIDHATGRQTARIWQHHERGQVLAFAAESIRDPCAHARKAGQDEAGVCHEHGRAMQRALALHRVNEGHVIDTGRELWEEIADPASALALLAKLPVAALAVARFRRKELHLAIGIEGFAAALCQLRLVVPRIHMAEAARAENLNHRTCLGGQGRTFGRERIRRGLRLAQHRRERHTAQTTAELPEEITT